MERHFLALFLCGAVIISGLSGCATTVSRVNTGDDRGPESIGLNYRDFEIAASEAVQKMLASGAVDNPAGGRYVLAVSRIVNDTMQRIDTDQLTKKIRVELLNSGKVVTTTAVGLQGPEDPMSINARKLRESDEFNQSTVAAKGQMISPDLSLSGKMIQRTQSVSSRQQRIENYLQLTLTDIRTGLGVWENETLIVKEGSKKDVPW